MKLLCDRVPAHDQPVVALARLGDYAFASASQGTVKLWKYTSGSQPESLFQTGGRDQVSSVASLTQGRWAVGYRSGKFEVFDLSCKLVRRKQQCSAEPILFFQEVSGHLWIGSNRGVTELAKWRPIKHIPRKIQSMSVYGDRHFLAAHDQGLECWTENGFKNLIFTYPISMFEKMRGRTLGVAASNDELSLWDFHPGDKVATWKTTRVVRVLSFDDSRFITTHADKTMKIWDIKAESPVRSYNVGCVVTSLLHLGNSEFLAAATKLSIFKP